MKPTFYLMCGLPGSGKSTYAKFMSDVKNDMGKSTAIHSSDALRKELYGDENDQDHNSEVFAELHKRIRNDLSNGLSVFYDATNINKKSRVRFLQSISHIACKKVCVVMAVPYEICLEQNSNRDRKVPEDVIRDMYMKWSTPYYDEGYDAITIVPGGLEHISHYSVDRFFELARGFDQGNHHHKLDLLGHSEYALDYIVKNCPDNKTLRNNKILRIAAAIHDNGKLFTKTNITRSGERSDEFHYYKHENVGAYNVLLYGITEDLMPTEILYLSNLVYYHMRPYSFEKNESAANNLKRKIGAGMFNDLMLLHEADKFAH